MSITTPMPTIFDLTGLRESDPNLIVVSEFKVTDPQTKTTRFGDKELFEVRFTYETPIRDENGFPLQKTIRCYGKMTVWKGKESDENNEIFLNRYLHFARYTGRAYCTVIARDLRDSTYENKNGNTTNAFSVGALDVLSVAPEQYDALALFQKYLKENEASSAPIEEPEDVDVF